MSCLETLVRKADPPPPQTLLLMLWFGDMSLRLFKKEQSLGLYYNSIYM